MRFLIFIIAFCLCAFSTGKTYAETVFSDIDDPCVAKASAFLSQIDEPDSPIESFNPVMDLHLLGPKRYENVVDFKLIKAAFTEFVLLREKPQPFEPMRAPPVEPHQNSWDSGQLAVVSGTKSFAVLTVFSPFSRFEFIRQRTHALPVFLSISLILLTNRRRE